MAKVWVYFSHYYLMESVSSLAQTAKLKWLGQTSGIIRYLGH
jgi:hypothetical protein